MLKILYESKLYFLFRYCFAVSSLPPHTYIIQYLILKYKVNGWENYCKPSLEQIKSFLFLRLFTFFSPHSLPFGSCSRQLRSISKQPMLFSFFVTGVARRRGLKLGGGRIGSLLIRCSFRVAGRGKLIVELRIWRLRGVSHWDDAIDFDISALPFLLSTVLY